MWQHGDISHFFLYYLQAVSTESAGRDDQIFDSVLVFHTAICDSTRGPILPSVFYSTFYKKSLENAKQEFID